MTAGGPENWPNPNRPGIVAIEAWEKAKEESQQADRRFQSALANLRKAADVLIKWILPDDAQDGEKIAVWYGAQLIQVTAVWDDACKDWHKSTITTRPKTVAAAKEPTP